MFYECGLKDIHVYPFGHLICYSDTYFDAGYRKKLAVQETIEDIGWKKSRYNDNKQIYNSQGFSDSDINKLIFLLETKLEYIRKHFEEDFSFEWHGNYNFIVAGVK